MSVAVSIRELFVRTVGLVHLTTNSERRSSNGSKRRLAMTAVILSVAMAGHVARAADDADTTAPIKSQRESAPPPAPPVLLNDREELIVDATGFDETGAIMMNGAEFTNSRWNYTSTGTAYIDLNLGRSYARFQTAIGLTDDSDTDITATFRILGDGTQLQTGTIALGQVATIDLDTTDILRLHIEYQSHGNGNIALGNPALTPATTG